MRLKVDQLRIQPPVQDPYAAAEEYLRVGESRHARAHLTSLAAGIVTQPGILRAARVTDWVPEKATNIDLTCREPPPTTEGGARDELGTRVQQVCSVVLVLGFYDYVRSPGTYAECAVLPSNIKMS